MTDALRGLVDQQDRNCFNMRHIRSAHYFEYLHPVSAIVPAREIRYREVLQWHTLDRNRILNSWRLTS